MILSQIFSLNYLKFSPPHPLGLWRVFLRIMKRYGYLFGVILAIEDTHRDEVFIEDTGEVIARNGQSLCSYTELVAIAREHNVNPWRLTIIDYDELITDDGI